MYISLHDLSWLHFQQLVLNHSSSEMLILMIIIIFSQMDLLDEKSREPLPYPYEMVFRLQKGRERES